MIEFFLFRLIKENICDKSTVPSVSAISRLLRGRDAEELKKSSKFFYDSLLVLSSKVSECVNKNALHGVYHPAPPDIDATYLFRSNININAGKDGSVSDWYLISFIRIIFHLK